ncbi:MAG: hypothetical protein M1840_008956 [Geoglossum simile]|nr:MAG: hypothetical protein M1840_008956 [Geoglossum simile]
MAGHKPNYYHELKNDVLEWKFVNLDDNDNYAEYDEFLLAPETSNFVVDFGTEGAWVARDINEGEVKGLLGLDVETEYSIYEMDTLAKHYEFSPRLCGLMCSEPLKPEPAASTEPPSATERLKEYTRQKRQQFRDSYQPPALQNSENHLELGRVPRAKGPMGLDVNHYHIADEVWHWSSTDYGKKFLCLGYNWLHNVEACKDDGGDSEEELSDVPSGRRLWTWLILCADGTMSLRPSKPLRRSLDILGTVISLHEDPFPCQTTWLQDDSRKELSAIRRNIRNVFRNLSKSDKAGVTENAISTLSIRQDVGPAADVDSSSPGDDAPSLLFFYLFDDWYTTYSLVRQQLREKPGLEQLQEIHQIGRQLAVLKRLYSSYKMIIDRVLEKQKPKNKLHRSLQGTLDHQRVTPPRPGVRTYSDGNLDGVLGATLSSSAIFKFQRLGDRIDLYVLSEIQQCLDEKESLVFMTFNLIAIKESQAVERLTRTTILLAKLTILFLPVSLMTGYFSVQISDLQGVYTHKTYWGCFGVIMFLSVMLLFTFGWISDR